MILLNGMAMVSLRLSLQDVWGFMMSHVSCVSLYIVVEESQVNNGKILEWIQPHCDSMIMHDLGLKKNIQTISMLVGGLEHFLFSHIVGIIIPID